AKIVSVRSYPRPPQTLATDLSADVRESGVSDSIKSRMTPSDDQAKAADATAASWVAAALGPTDSDPIGVIVLWPDDAVSDANNSRDTRQLLFVLVKGESAGSGTRIVRISYGDPLQLTAE
ncbi:MAG: hypothetical protein ACREJC_09475, partial [Tepidisphaeraceae bacterium]